MIAIIASIDGNVIFLESEFLGFFSDSTLMTFLLFLITSALPLLNNLRPLIKGKKEIEAVNFLLRFVQTSFKYKTDQENFSYEKVLFPEETLFYAYSDCEDRSIMFSFLIKNLTNLDIVAIKYKNHLATAVKFSNTLKGERIFYNQEEYLIADPTYINANAGMIMPQFRGKKYEIILIK